MRTSAIPRFTLCAAALAFSLSGCITTSPPPSTSLCTPRFTIEPAVVPPGGTITLASDTECDAAQPNGGWSVLIAPVGRPDEGVRTTVTDVFDGSFSVNLSVPATFPIGEAFAGIENWDYSECRGSGSCASASASFTVR
jgi:hypothetical protein